MIPTFKSDEARRSFAQAYAAALAHWPIAFEELDVPTQFGTTHVIASGQSDAPPVILLPCMLGTAIVWRPNAAALSDHFRIYAVDIPGQPNRSSLTKLIRNRHEQAEWCTELLGGLGIRKASFIGNSYGGFLALSQACLTPDRVDKLILISPAGTFSPLSGALIGAALAMFGTTGKGGIWRGVENGVPLDQDWKALVEIGLRQGRLTKTLRLAPKPLTGQELRAVKTVPLLIIGDKELLYAPERELALARKRLPALEGLIVPRANHIAAMSNPHALNRWMVAKLLARD